MRIIAPKRCYTPSETCEHFPQWDVPTPTIPLLMAKLNFMSGRVKKDNEGLNLNLATNNEDSGLLLSREGVGTKLKRIENNFELYKADRQLLYRRKKFERVKQKEHNQSHDSPFKIKQTKIQDTFLLDCHALINNEKTIRWQHSLKNKDNGQTKNQKKQYPNSNSIQLLYQNQLKKHRKIYNYTIQQILQKDRRILINDKLERKLSFKNGMEKCCSQERHNFGSNDLLLESQMIQKSVILEGQMIADRRMQQMFTKKRSKRINYPSQSSRVTSFFSKQDQIFNDINERPFSKQNAQKLRQKMNEIANAISFVENKYSSRSIERAEKTISYSIGLK